MKYFISPRNAVLACALTLSALCPPASFADEKDANSIAAARVLEKKKDAASKKQAAEIYLSNAFYEKALTGLVAAGEAEPAARRAVVAAAFAAGHRKAALDMAAAGNELPAARAENVRLLLAEGRAAAALELAKEAGDGALLRTAKEALYREAVGGRYEAVPLKETGYLSARASPDGRFLILTKDGFRDPASLDLRSLKPGSPRTLRPIAPGLKVDALDLDEDGRFIAALGRPVEGKNAEILSYSIERLDTGAVIASGSLPSKLQKGQKTAVVLAGALLYVQVDRTLALLDPFTGKAEASAPLAAQENLSARSESENLVLTYDDASKEVRHYDGTELKPAAPKHLTAKSPRTPKSTFHDTSRFFADERRNAVAHVSERDLSVIVVDFDTGAALRAGNPGIPIGGKNESVSYSLKDVLLSPDGNTLIALASDKLFISPFPFLEREAAATTLALDLKKTDELAAIAWRLISEGRIEDAKRLAKPLGVDEKKIAVAVGEYHLKRRDYKQAAEQFMAAGEPGRVTAMADGLVRAAAPGSVVSAYRDAEALYLAAGAPTEPLALETARLQEKNGSLYSAVDFYARAGAAGDVERIVFSPRNLNESWCLEAGAKIGLSAEEVYARMGGILESEKRWTAAAELYDRRRNAAAVERVVRTAFAGSNWDRGLVDLVKRKKDPKLARAAAGLLSEQGDAENSAALLESIGDAEGIVRLADRAYDDGDLFAAAPLYEKTGSRSARAKSAARFLAVFEELRGAVKSAEYALSVETLQRINGGALPLAWPIPADRLADPGYRQLKDFGDALAALPSKPSAAEAAGGSLALKRTAMRALKAERYTQADFDQRRAEWYSFAAKMLTAMGR